MTTAAELYSLQEIDLALDKSVARLAEIECELGESEELIAARQVTSEKEDAAAQIRSKQTDLEWSVDEVQGKASAVEVKLYGGSVRNPKELSDLDADLRSLKTQVLKREDALLTLLVELEDAESEFKIAQAAFAEIEEQWRDGQDQLNREKMEIEPDIERLRSSRDKESARVDRAALSLYQALRQRRAGLAIARVERGMCQGCRITLPVSVLQKARSGMSLVQCVSCERMLLVS